METQILKIKYEGKTAFINIEPLSDIHVGSKFHDKAKFKEVVERIRDDPSRYTFLLGDLFDMTFPDNKFYDSETVDPELPTLEDQFQYLLKMLLPIRHKILGVLTGNHDERLRLKHWDNIVLRLVRELNRDYPEAQKQPDLPRGPIKYLGYMAITRLVFVRQFESEEEHVDSSFDVFTWHGGYSGRRVGGNLNNTEDLAAHFSADIYLTGHTHQIVIDKKVKVHMDRNGHLAELVKVFAVCGSFLRGYNPDAISYSEVKGLPPTRVGTITVSIFPYERKVQAHE